MNMYRPIRYKPMLVNEINRLKMENASLKLEKERLLAIINNFNNALERMREVR